MFIDENLESIGLQRENKVITCSQPHSQKTIVNVLGVYPFSQCSVYKFTYTYLYMWIILYSPFYNHFNLTYRKHFFLIIELFPVSFQGCKLICHYLFNQSPILGRCEISLNT